MTTQSQHIERQAAMAVVQCQMSIAIAALAIQIIARWCFALGCGTEKNLNGIHLLPSHTNHTSIGSTYGSDSYIGNSVAQHSRWGWSWALFNTQSVDTWYFFV